MTDSEKFLTKKLEGILDMDTLVRTYNILSSANVDSETIRHIMRAEAFSLVSSAIDSVSNEITAEIAERAQ